MNVAFLDSVHPILWQRLTEAGHACWDGTQTTREALLKGAFRDADGVVVRARITLDEPAIHALPQLKFIARSGSGLDNIDTACAHTRGIQIFNSPEGNRNAVAEHTLGLLLALLRKIHPAHASVTSGQWLREAHRGVELSGLTVGIIGFGNTGSAFASKLTGMGCQVLAFDKYRTDFDGSHGVQACSLMDIQSQCDVISIHIPLNEESRGWVNDTWFAALRKPVWFLHTARGPIASTDAIYRALCNGQLLGAALDVLEEEEASLEGLKAGWSSHPIFQHPHAIFSPHIAGWTKESWFRLSDVLADKILAAY